MDAREDTDMDIGGKTLISIRDDEIHQILPNQTMANGRHGPKDSGR